MTVREHRASPKRSSLEGAKEQPEIVDEPNSEIDPLNCAGTSRNPIQSSSLGDPHP